MNTKVGMKSVEKLHKTATDCTHKCSCGHSVVIYPMEHVDRKICSWCGNYVYMDKEKQKQYDFKLKMGNILRKGKNA